MSKQTDSAGSYAFGQFSENESELERLKRQARIAGELERRVLVQSGVQDGMDVLDLACGPGVVSSLLASMVPNGRVIGMDLSEALLQNARQLAKEEKLGNLEFYQGDVYHPELPHGSFDFIYARFLFQHLADPLEALASIRPLLKPGGILCVADIDDDWLSLYPSPEAFRQFTALAGEGQRGYGGDRNIGRKLASYLEQTGFESVKPRIETVNSSDIGLRSFLDITTGFKREQLGEQYREQGDELLTQIYKVLDTPQTWGYVAVFFVSGVMKVRP